MTSNGQDNDQRDQDQGQDQDPAQAIIQRQGNQITGSDEEQPASGLRPALEPKDRGTGDGGHRGDGGGVGKSL